MNTNTQPPVILTPTALDLPYPEHLGPAGGTDTLSCRLPILHGYGLGVLHFRLGAALDTIGLRHMSLLFLAINDRRFFPTMLIVSNSIGDNKSPFCDIENKWYGCCEQGSSKRLYCAAGVTAA